MLIKIVKVDHIDWLLVVGHNLKEELTWPDKFIVVNTFNLNHKPAVLLLDPRTYENLNKENSLFREIRATMKKIYQWNLKWPGAM